MQNAIWKLPMRRVRNRAIPLHHSGICSRMAKRPKYRMEIQSSVKFLPAIKQENTLSGVN